MKLQELLAAVQAELEEAGCASKGATLSLAFTVKRETGGEVECDFVDARAISKPRPEEIHRLELPLKAAGAASTKQRDVRAAELGAEVKMAPAPPEPETPFSTPPALPPKRK